MLTHLKSYSNEQLLNELFKSSLGNYTAEEFAFMRGTIWDGLQKNKSHVDIANRIKSLNEKIAEDAVKLSKTLVKAYYRIRKLQKALIAEIEWFEYVGIYNDKTCSFCRPLLNNHYHIEEILSLLGLGGKKHTKV